MCSLDPVKRKNSWSRLLGLEISRERTVGRFDETTCAYRVSVSLANMSENACCKLMQRGNGAHVHFLPFDRRMARLCKQHSKNLT